MRRAREALKRPLELRRHRRGGRALPGGVPPEVAHQAAKRALPIGDEDRRHVLDAALGGPLGLREPGVGPRRVLRGVRTARGEDLPISEPRKLEHR